MGALLLGLASAAPAGADEIVHQRRGRFGAILVVDDGADRYLRFGGVDGDEQTWIKKGHPEALPMEYLRAAAVGLGLGPRRVLVVGLGGGSFPTFVHHHLPAVRVEAVEVDPEVVDVARRYFGLSDDVTVHVADGARFLHRGPERWDLILIDAYGDVDYPRQLGTPAFFRDVKERLSPSGVAVLNLAVDSELEEKRLVRRFEQQLGTCFVVPVEDAGNVVVMGGPGLRSAAQLGEALKARPLPVEPALARSLERAAARTRPCREGLRSPAATGP